MLTQTEELEIVQLKSCTFKVKPSRDSAFKEFETVTDLPHLHLVIVDTTEKLEWSDISACGIKNGELIDACDEKMDLIVKHFFGDDSQVEDFAWRYAVNSPNAISVKTVHIHLYLAHKNLFGKEGMIQRCVDPLLKLRVN